VEKLVYIAGKISDTTPKRRERNVEIACEVAERLASYAVPFFCPHSHTSRFGHRQPRKFWYELDLEVLRGCCSAILMLPNWKESEGAKAELAEAERLGLKVFWSVDEVLRSRGIVF
jgi:hypothetical protein